MDLKRNYSSNIQAPNQIKGSHLINPIVDICKASTPVRTRIIKPGSQLNSTPVNVHKIGVPARSPAILNKQNQQTNGRIALKKSKCSEPSFNLSPIMALNRKMSQGPQELQRALTPNGFKRQQSLANLVQRKNYAQNQHLFGQTLKDSRSSNGFRNMLDSRSKSPTRIAFGQIFQKQNNGQQMKNSGSSQTLLQGVQILPQNKLRQSRNVKLVQSRSFEQLISLGTPTIKDGQVLCSNSNQHQKKVRAKYKVVEDTQDEQLLVYCSKCAINLVQKGFKVQDLSQQDINRIKNSKNQVQINEYYEYASQTCRKLQIKLSQLRYEKQSKMMKYQKDLDDVDRYYGSIISYIQSQKRKDKQIILKNKQKERSLGQQFERKLHCSLQNLRHMLKNGKINSNELSTIQNIQALLTEKCFNFQLEGADCFGNNIEQKFNHFLELFENMGKLKFQFSQQNTQQQYYTKNQCKQRNQCPLRFSFEKNMKQMRKSPLAYRNNSINPLQQAPQSMQKDDSGDYSYGNEKKAFRTLFPQQQQFNGGDIKQTNIYSPTFKQI